MKGSRLSISYSMCLRPVVESAATRISSPNVSKLARLHLRPLWLKAKFEELKVLRTIHETLCRPLTFPDVFLQVYELGAILNPSAGCTISA